MLFRLSPIAGLLICFGLSFWLAGSFLPAAADPAYDDYVRAQRFIQNNQMSQAVAALSRAIKSDPKYLNAYIARGFAYSRLGQVDAALIEYDKVLSIAPQNAVALSNKGVCLCKLKRYEEALQCLERAHQLDPEAADILANRAEVYLQLGQYDKAIEDCTLSIKIDDADADPYITRADALVQKKKNKQALVDYSKAISLNPDPVHMFHAEGESYYKRGLVYQAMGKSEEAERDFQDSSVFHYKPAK